MEKSRRQFLKFLVAVYSFIIGFFFSFNWNGGFKFGKVKTGSVGTPEAHAKSGSSCDCDTESKFPSEGLYFNENGTRFDPAYTPTPNLCFVCKYYNDNGSQGVICRFTRADHRRESTFRCDDYE
jgi:hypothetical protein|tara:strand:- start:192 stop:563 length:372 start_codon:yes stop_codon:yes gene_type:complete